MKRDATKPPPTTNSRFPCLRPTFSHKATTERTDGTGTAPAALRGAWEATSSNRQEDADLQTTRARRARGTRHSGLPTRTPAGAGRRARCPREAPRPHPLSTLRAHCQSAVSGAGTAGPTRHAPALQGLAARREPQTGHGYTWQHQWTRHSEVRCVTRETRVACTFNRRPTGTHRERQGCGVWAQGQPRGTVSTPAAASREAICCGRRARGAGPSGSALAL